MFSEPIDPNAAPATPDFVVIGQPVAPGEFEGLPDGGVMLFASMELSRADLEYQAAYRDVYSGSPLGGSSTIHPVWRAQTSNRRIIHIDMGTHIRIFAPDYPSAYQALFKQWNPEKPNHGAIAEGQRAIDG